MIKKFEDLNYYELFQIPYGASSFEVRQAYKNILAIYEETSLATYSLFTEDERRDILSKIEKAFLTLIDEQKRTSYDNELVNSGEIPEDILIERAQKKAIPIFQINQGDTSEPVLGFLQRINNMTSPSLSGIKMYCNQSRFIG